MTNTDLAVFTDDDILTYLEVHHAIDRYGQETRMGMMGECVGVATLDHEGAPELHLYHWPDLRRTFAKASAALDSQALDTLLTGLREYKALGGYTWEMENERAISDLRMSEEWDAFTPDV